jgi:AraC-like DNA-binding protein
VHHIDFHSFPIQHHSIHFVSPGQVHQVLRKADSKGYVLLFSRDFYSSDQRKLREFPFLNNYSLAPILNLSKERYEQLSELISKINEEQNSGAAYTRELIKAYLNTFLIQCKRFFDSEKDLVPLLNSSLSFRFKQLIEEHYLEIRSVSQFAEMLNSSEKQLAAATKKELGLTPKALIDERVLLEAKRLVKYTEHSFQEIAFFLNFSDASHFAKFFKAKAACSPGEYREK